MAIVTLYDVNEMEIVNWAKKNCPSFTSWLVYENNELVWAVDELTWQTRYEFDIADEQQALIFQLKWQGQSYAT